MLRYIGKRILLMFGTLFFIVLFTFLLMHAIPGGPFTAERKLPDAVEQALNEKYHLNDPLAKQFFDYLQGLIRLDLGPSFKYAGQRVNEFIESGFPVSARLGSVTIIFVILLSIPLGVFAALHNGKWQDLFIMVLATLGVTIPSFVIATLLIYIFAFKLNLLPIFGLNSWKGYILPVSALGGYSLAFITRLIRSSLLEVMGQDYIRTARAKGLPEYKVILFHALRNAVIPVITIIGPTIAAFLTGSFVIEKIFALPGLGIHFVTSISNRDYTTIMGVTVFYAAFLVVMTLIVDIFYVMVDPRIKLQ
ncbi:MAG: ABC transporter permease [Treponema sp.]|nr:ABC transporter permease [Treponema sp.]